MYPLYNTPAGHPPDGVITKADRMNWATHRFTAYGRAPLTPAPSAYSLWMLAYRFVNPVTGEQSAFVPLGLVRIQRP